MESIIVYLGSSHTILEPKFDIRETSLRMELEYSHGAEAACRCSNIGVLNTYHLNLNELTVVEASDASIDHADVVLYENADVPHIRIQSNRALNHLQFIQSEFVSNK